MLVIVITSHSLQTDSSVRSISCHWCLDALHQVMSQDTAVCLSSLIQVSYAKDWLPNPTCEPRILVKCDTWTLSTHVMWLEPFLWRLGATCWWLTGTCRPWDVVRGLLPSAVVWHCGPHKTHSLSGKSGSSGVDWFKVVCKNIFS